MKKKTTKTLRPQTGKFKGQRHRINIMKKDTQKLIKMAENEIAEWKAFLLELRLRAKSKGKKEVRKR